MLVWISDHDGDIPGRAGDPDGRERFGRLTAERQGDGPSVWATDDQFEVGAGTRETDADLADEAVDPPGIGPARTVDAPGDPLLGERPGSNGFPRAVTVQ